jgi:arylsulfatase A-like enzyme
MAIVYPKIDLIGFHGYDPEHPSMAAIFVAFGRGARPGTRLPPVHSLDVAPTVLALLGVEVPDWMEGQPIAGLLPPAAGQ